MQPYQNNVQDRQGNAIVGAQVLVTNSAGAMASIYSDDGVTPLSNPFYTDADGEFKFFVDTGSYSVTITSSKIPAPVVFDGINIIDSAEILDQIASIEENIDYTLLPKASILGNLDAMPINQQGTAKQTTIGLIKSETSVAAASAQAAAIAAEVARDAAQLSAGVFADPAAGISGTSSGDYFSVPSAEGDEYLNLYLNNSGVADLVQTYPSASAVQSVTAAIGIIEKLSPLIVQNDDVDSKGIGGIGTDLRHYQATPRGLWPLRDADMQNPLGADGWPAFDAIPQTYPGTVTTAATCRVPDDWAQTLYIIPFFGQSLAGGANDNPADTIFNPTPTYPAQAFMPLSGNKPDGTDFDQLQPLYEYAGTGFDSNRESPLTTMMNTLIADLYTLTGTQPKLATFMASRGSRTWAQIGPGNVAWTVLMKGIEGCCKAARAMGLRPVVPAVMYLQGEQDRSIGLPRIETQRNRLNMAKAVRRAVYLMTGQVEDTVIFVSQPNNSTVGNGSIPGHMLAPLDLDGQEGIRVLPPHYPYEIPVNVHPDSASYVTMGRLLATAVRDEVFGPGYYPLKVVEARWFSSTQIDLVYSLKNGPLVIDASGAVVAPPTWTGSLYGYQVFDENGLLTINSASVITDTTIESASGGADRIIRLTLSSAPSGRSVRVHYATRCDGTGANAGRLTGARGCIRNSATNPIWANSQVIHL